MNYARYGSTIKKYGTTDRRSLTRQLIGKNMSETEKDREKRAIGRTHDGERQDMNIQFNERHERKGFTTTKGNSISKRGKECTMVKRVKSARSKGEQYFLLLTCDPF